MNQGISRWPHKISLKNRSTRGNNPSCNRTHASSSQKALQLSRPIQLQQYPPPISARPEAESLVGVWRRQKQVNRSGRMKTEARLPPRPTNIITDCNNLDRGALNKTQVQGQKAEHQSQPTSPTPMHSIQTSATHSIENNWAKHPQQKPFTLDNPNESSKFSLRTNIGVISYIRKQLRICLKYSDLRGSSLLLANQNNSHQDVERYHLYLKNSNKRSVFSDILCSITNRGKNGCKCVPQCHWINRWKSIILNQKSSPLSHEREIDSEEWQKVVGQVEKDLPRTFPSHPAFSRSTEQLDRFTILRQSLLDFCRRDSECSYMQGMNFLFGVLVYHCPQLSDVSTIAQYLMVDLNLRELYLGDLTFAKKMVGGLMTRLGQICFDLYIHLKRQYACIEDLILGWYFSVLAAFIPLDSMHLVLDKIIVVKGVNGINEIILVLLLLLKDEILQQQEEELLVYFNNKEMSERCFRVDWAQILIKSDDQVLNMKFDL